MSWADLYLYLILNYIITRISIWQLEMQGSHSSVNEDVPFMRYDS